MASPRIDLRSDTVTQPSPEMRRAMAEAELGDDVFGDDPTVIALEERAAELTGKEAGLFVASGTMGNLVSLMAHVPRGGEIIAEAESHTVFDEAGGHAVVVGATTRPIPAGPDGTMDPDAIRAAFRDPRDPHEPLTALVVLENTHGHSMGQPLSAAYTSHIARLAHAGLREPDGPPAPGRARPRRRGAAVERRRRARHARAGPPAGRGLGDLLPFEGARLPGRLGRRGHARLHLAGAPRAQAARRRHAPGRRPRRARA